MLHHRLRAGVFALLVSVLLVPAATQAATYGDTSTYISKPFHYDRRLNSFFDFPADVEVNNKGNLIIADTYNNTIVRIKDGKVKRTAGTGSYGHANGSRLDAEFAYPKGVAAKGGKIYVADTDNNLIRKIDSGVVSDLASADTPKDVEVFGSKVYYFDGTTLKKMNTNGTDQQTVASGFSDPAGLDINSDGSYAVVADEGANKVKRVKLSNGDITSYGSGEAGTNSGSKACSNAKFEYLRSVAWLDDDTILVGHGDGLIFHLERIDLSGSCQMTHRFTDDTQAELNYPDGFAVASDGTVYIASTGDGAIMKIQSSVLIDDTITIEGGGYLNTYAGEARFNVNKSKPVLFGNPKYLVLSKNKKNIFVAENNRIRKFSRTHLKNSSLVAGSILDNYNKNDNKTYTKGDARFSDVFSMQLSADGKSLFVVDRNNNRIRKVEISSGAVTYLTGAGKINLEAGASNDYADGDACPNQRNTGKADCAYLSRPTGSALSNDGKRLFVADSGNNRIRTVNTETGHVSTLAGSGSTGFSSGVGTAASFSAPIGLALSTDGNTLYVADRDNHAIRAINVKQDDDNYKSVTTVTGTGAAGYKDATFGSAVFSLPESLAVRDDILYVAEVGSNRVRLLDFDAQVTKTVAGSGERGYENGARGDARFNNPRGLLALKKNLLLAELFNDTIRKIYTNGTAPYADAAPAVSDTDPGAVGKEWSSGDINITITGSGFRHGASAYLGTTKVKQTSIVSSSSAVLTLQLQSLSSGTYDVTFINDDGQKSTLDHGFQIHQGGIVAGNTYEY